MAQCWYKEFAVASVLFMGFSDNENNIDRLLQTYLCILLDWISRPCCCASAAVLPLSTRGFITQIIWWCIKHGLSCSETLMNVYILPPWHFYPEHLKALEQMLLFNLPETSFGHAPIFRGCSFMRDEVLENIWWLPLLSKRPTLMAHVHALRARHGMLWSYRSAPPPPLTSSL